MAVSGKKAPQSTYTASFRGSDEDLEIYCQPCDLEGERLPANGFCINCSEHLCRTCFQLHKKHKLSRNHILLDKENMPKQLNLTSSTLQQGDDFTKPCSTHQKEMIKFYCHVHEELLCSVCVTLQHTGVACKVDYIPDVSGEVVDSKDYRDILRNMDRITDQYRKILEDTKKMTTKSETSLTSALVDIKKFRREINQRLDELERQVQHAAKALQVEIDNNLKTVETNCDDVSKSMKMVSDSIKQLNTSKQADRLFMELKMADQMIKDYEGKIHNVSSYDVKEYNFQPNENISAVLKKETKIGTLSKKRVKQQSASAADHVKTRHASFQTKICVETPKDKNLCDITGMTVLTPDLLIIIDWNNTAIKMVNIRNQSITDQVHVDSTPFDITSVTDTELAVTLPIKNTIQFISASSDKLIKKHSIKVDGRCWGISCRREKLVVSFCKPAKVQILDINGMLLTTVKGDDIFMSPRYVTASSDSVYVSDWQMKTITILNWQGKVVGSYDGMDDPTGITLSENGTVFVCDQNKIIIQELSQDLTKGSILLKDVKNPKAVCWCGETNCMFVSYETTDSKYDNILQIYKLS